MPMALFAGLLLDLNNIPVWLRWLDFFSIIKYGYQLLVINQYNGACVPASFALGDGINAHPHTYLTHTTTTTTDRELSCSGSLFCRWKTGADVMKVRAFLVIRRRMTDHPSDHSVNRLVAISPPYMYLHDDAHTHTPQYVGTTPDSASETVGILIALIIIFRLLAFIFLTMKSNRAH